MNKLSKEELENVVAQNKTVAGVLRQLGYDTTGGRYSWIKRLIVKYDIDTSHFTGQGWKRDSIEYLSTDLFSEHSTKKRSQVRDTILKKHIIDYKCSFCGNTGEWMGKQIALQLDHINGVPNDNRIENLRFLCPNCHAMTDTYCGKNISKSDNSDNTYNKRTNNCVICGKSILNTSTYCVQCASQRRRKINNLPNKDELAKLIIEKGFVGVGKMYDVTDNAVRKWCIKYNLPTRKNEIYDLYYNQ